MNGINNDFVRENNARILESFAMQPRYKPEFTELRKKDREKLTADERRLLMAVDVYQYKFTKTQIAEVVGFSACKSTRLFKTLEQAEMIKIVSIVKGKGISKYPVLLEQAYNLLNLEEKKFYGKGAGYEHVVWQFLIAEHFSEFKPAIELNKAGKFIDVAVEREKKLIAIEVAMTSVNEKINVEKDFAVAEADRVIVACRDLKVLEEVRQIIFGMEEGIRQKTEARLLSEVLRMDLKDLLGLRYMKSKV
jgi:hypothetical protein